MLLNRVFSQVSRGLRTSACASAASERRYTPRRALMYVPGSDDRKLAKIPKLGADCICLDCEDGVAITKKEEARTGIRKILDERTKVDLFGKSECTIRVNSIESGLTREDLEVTLNGPNVPDAIHLPKVDDPGQIQEFATMYSQTKASNVDTKIGLIVFIESARALLQLPVILSRATDLRSNTNLVAEAVVFGSDDFVADIGAVRTPEAEELLYARQKIVANCKAFGLQAIDLVHTDYKDLEGLKKQSEAGARMGFTGKQVIHPGQISVVQEAFSPSPERVEWATQLIKEFNEHVESGKGAFTFRGHMIDMPLVKQAQNIVHMKEVL